MYFISNKVLSFLLLIFILLIFHAIILLNTKPKQEGSQRICSEDNQTHFRRINLLQTDYNQELKNKLMKIIARNALPNDSDVIRLIRDLMDPPSNHMVKRSNPITKMPQTAAVEKILKGKVRRSPLNIIYVSTSLLSMSL